ncbi:hypothetical protein MRX96_034581 [Rhipicephalus microplus]
MDAAPFLVTVPWVDEWATPLLPLPAIGSPASTVPGKPVAVGAAAVGTYGSAHQVATTPYGEEPLLYVRIGLPTFKAMLDTGSSISFFGLHAVAAAQASGAKPKADVRVLSLASGWSQPTMSLKRQIEWAASCRRQQFLCVPDLCHDVVLGRDFLTVSGISLHVPLGGWTVGTEPQIIVPFVKAVKKQPEALDGFGENLRCIFAEGHASVYASVPEVTAACNVIIPGHSSDLDTRIKHVLEEFSEIFNTTPPGCKTLAEHRINTGDNPPVRWKLRPPLYYRCDREAPQENGQRTEQ